MSEITYDQMRDLLNQQADRLGAMIGKSSSNFASSSKPQSSGSGASGSEAAGTAVLSGAVNVVGTGMAQITQAAADLATGSMTAKTALSQFSQVVNEISPALASGLKGVGNAAIDVNESMKQTGRAGFDAAGDMGKYNKAIRDSGVDQEALNYKLKDGANAYSGMGLTMNKAMENVLGFSRDLQETPAIELMKKAGTTQQEVAELAMVSAKNRMGLDLNDKQSRAEMLENTIALSGEMNEVARLTGMSRQEQMAKLAKDKENVVIQAELMGMDKDATNRYEMLKEKMMPLGDSVGKLADEIFTGGIRTKEGADRMAAMGPAGKAFEQAVLMQKDAVTVEQKQRAEAAMARAKDEIAAYQQTEQYRSQVKLDKSSVGDEARKMMAENKELAGRRTARVTADAQAAPGERKLTDAEIQQSRADAAGRDTKRVDAAGKPLPGAEASTALNQVQERIYQESRTAAKLLDEINRKVVGPNLQNKEVKSALSARDAAGEYRVKPGTDNASKDTTLMGQGTQQLGNAANAINNVVSQGTANTANRPNTNSGLDPTALKPRAEGGPVQPGEPYWVGEDGPEIVEFPAEGNVIPTDEISKLSDKPKTSAASAKSSSGMPDFGSMLKGLMPDMGSIKESLPDFGSLFKSNLFPKTEELKTEMPNMDDFFAGMMPDISAMSESAPNMDDFFAGMMPDITLLSDEAPDMDDLFAGMMPDEATLENSMPDMSGMFDSLAIGADSAVESIKLPDLSPPKDAAKYDDFGKELTAKNQSAVEPVEVKKESASLSSESGATLSDLKEQLIQLNTAVTQLIAHSAQTAENSGAAVKATKDLSGNLYT